MWPFGPCPGLPLDVQPLSFFPVLLWDSLVVVFSDMRLGFGVFFLAYLENWGHQKRQWPLMIIPVSRQYYSSPEQGRLKISSVPKQKC